jgi:phosphoglycolate phosphatase
VLAQNANKMSEISYDVLDWETYFMKILALDLDGTLVDSGMQIYQSLATACIDFLGVQISPTLVSDNLGLPILSILRRTPIPTESHSEIVSMFRQNLEEEILQGNTLFNGVIEFLSIAKEMNFILAIATSKPTYLAKLVVQHSELRNFIDFVQGTDGFPPKPNPEILTRIQESGMGDVIAMIGDRIEDIQAAQQASIKGIGVAQSAHSTRVLERAGADYAFESIADMLASNVLKELS